MRLPFVFFSTRSRMINDEAEEAREGEEDEGGNGAECACALCDIGGFIPEQRGCMPSANGTIRSIMRQHAQSWKQVPEAKRYHQFAETFNARVADPALAVAEVAHAAELVQKVAAGGAG